MILGICTSCSTPTSQDCLYNLHILNLRLICPINFDINCSANNNILNILGELCAGEWQLAGVSEGEVWHNPCPQPYEVDPFKLGRQWAEASF